MVSEEEILLTKEEIAFISNKAQYSLMMHNPGIMQVTKNWWDVMHITPFKKLLFIQGHRFTGLQHINRRHRYYTNEHSPVNGGFVITSKFAPDSGTLDDYTRLSEFLYDDKHKVDENKNKHPDLFDVFRAKVEFKERSEFCLIVYKDSKIIHTLFPIEKNKKVKKYKKQDFHIEYSEPKFIRGVIPYTDTDDKVRFALGVIMDMAECKEIWAGLVYKDDKLHGTVQFGEMKIQYATGYEWRIEALNCADLSKYENIILDLVKKHNL